MPANKNPDSSRPKYSDEFNAEDAEVTYESSDGVRFRIHSVYLRAHTEVLAPLPESTFDEIVHLEEPSLVLEMLFKFIYPRRQPDLDTLLEFEVLKGLAEAAEKYQVYPAMYAANLRMRDILPNEAHHILAYALKHDYRALIDEAAPLALDVPTWDLLNAIPATYHETWLKYHNHWQEAQRRALTTHLVASTSSLNTQIMASVSANLLALHRLDEILNGQAAGWKLLIKADISQIPRLTMLVSSPATIGPEPSILQGVLPQGDLRIICDDGIVLRLDSTILKACASGVVRESFRGSEIEVDEKSSVMIHMLQFIQPVRSPDVGSLPFDELEELARVAEKYRVFQAMQICKRFMKKRLPLHPENIFLYAAQFGYHDILDVSAPLVLHLSLDDLMTRLPSALLFPWARYHQRWQAVCTETMLSLTEHGFNMKSQDNYNGNHVAGRCACGIPFSTHIYHITKKLLEGPKSLMEIKSLLSRDNECSRTRNPGFGLFIAPGSKTFYERCWETIEEDIQAIPRFSTFI